MNSPRRLPVAGPKLSAGPDPACLAGQTDCARLSERSPRKARPGRRERPLAIRQTILLIALLPGVAAAQESPWRTGTGFHTRLHETWTANWRNVELRTVLEQVGHDREIAILLDRRIDPNAMPPVDFVGEPLAEGFSRLAEQLHGGASFPDNVVYLGPRDSARKLRTLIALRTGELSSEEFQVPKDRRQTWLKRKTVRWDDLDSPREILDRLQAELNFRIVHPELIEHDLWAEAVLPHVTAVEAISLVLIQFDLTFAWRDGGQRIELTPAPEKARIEKTHPLRGKSAERALAEWRSTWPDAEVRVADRQIAALATIEEHEAMSAGKPMRTAPAAGNGPPPLARRQFTLKIKDVSARDLMRELEKSGVTFEFDAQALADAGVDLDRFIELNVRKLSAEEFFHRVFDPLGVKFTIEGLSVKLAPK